MRVVLGNVIAVGVSVYVAATPVPDREMDCVVVPIRNENEAIFGPAVVGRNVTVMVQLALAVSDVPQVRASVNWLEFVPVIVGALSANAAAVLLRTVTSCAVPLFSTWLPKARVVGETVNGEGATTV